MNGFIELPSLDEITAMDMQRQQAIEALAISNDSNTVKCQRCGNAVPLLNRTSSTTQNSVRIETLQRQIKLIEHYARRLGRDINSPSFIDDRLMLLSEIK